MEITTSRIKEKAIALGFDLCGIAPVERFSKMPEKTNPYNILSDCKSVIVVAKRFLQSTIKATSTIPYTIVRNILSNFIDLKTIELSQYIEDRKYTAIPTGAMEPCNYNSEIDKTVGLISLKNAAVQAGLGVIGKNTLLITPQYGNMVWLGAIITDLELEYDQVMTNNPCGEECQLCISDCPVHAISGGLFIDQKKCWEFAFGKDNDEGEWRIKCFRCRSVCPYSRGF